MGSAYTLVFDGYADWEIGYVLAELRRSGNLDVVSVGFSDRVVTSMGGLRVLPDMILSQVDLDDVLILIMPGGLMWTGDYPETDVNALLLELAAAQTPVAAICAATAAVGRAGLLKNREHTSNSLEFLCKNVPAYSDRRMYTEALAARDRHVITASGLGSVEFALEVFNELDVTNSEMRTIWYDAFKHGINPHIAADDA